MLIKLLYYVGLCNMKNTNRTKRGIYIAVVMFYYCVMWVITWKNVSDSNKRLHKCYVGTVSCSNILTLFTSNYHHSEDIFPSSIIFIWKKPHSVYYCFLPSSCPNFADLVLLLAFTFWKWIHAPLLFIVLNNTYDPTLLQNVTS